MTKKLKVVKSSVLINKETADPRTAELQGILETRHANIAYDFAMQINRLENMIKLSDKRDIGNTQNLVECIKDLLRRVTELETKINDNTAKDTAAN